MPGKIILVERLSAMSGNHGVDKKFLSRDVNEVS